VLLAAVRERMLEITGEVADGLLAHVLQTPDVLRNITLPAVHRGLARAGRSPDDFEVCLSAFVATSDEEWEAIRRRVAFYGSTPGYRHVLDHHGLSSLFEALHQRSRDGDWASMPALVDDDVVGLFAVRGDDAQAVAAEVHARLGGLADRVSLLGERPDLDRLAAVAAAVRAL
jgi:alkanesulfonate monooxygenase SsuD/methylene tetrahydromethanopterin reductase-like flavin-dependent oxidoreductase (luciferase family)